MISIIITLVGLFVIIVLSLVAILPQIIASISSIIARMPAAVEKFQAFIASLDNGGPSHELVVSIQESMNTATEYV